MRDAELIREILSQIITGAERIERRFKNIHTPDSFLDTEEGIDRLDSICMMLIAVGESLKNLDKITDGALLKQYPEIDWKGAKGARDIISHHYFDLNADIVFDICKEKIPPMKVTLQKMLKDIDDGITP